VRDDDEAARALDGGADWIDVKEPRAGPLGAATKESIEAVVTAVNGRVPVSAALGELRDLDVGECFAASTAVPGVGLYKVGLAGMRTGRWDVRLMEARRLLRAASFSADLVAVAYADGLRAAAPDPDAVREFATAAGFSTLLLDTWDKAGGSVIEIFGMKRLAAWVGASKRAGLRTVIAGSLGFADLVRVANLGPDIIAVRGAATDGARDARVTEARVAELAGEIRNAAVCERAS